MTVISIEIQITLVGKQPALMENDLVLSLVKERLTVASLIRLIVTECMQKLAAHQSATLLSADKEASASLTSSSQGKEESSVLFSSRLLYVPVLQTEIEKALRAFELGRYLLLVNRHRVNALDEEIVLSSGTQIQFLRLIPLVGG
jgi:hypothetical protein